MFSRNLNDTSRVVRKTIVGDATSWRFILTTLESPFMILVCL